MPNSNIRLPGQPDPVPDPNDRRQGQPTVRMSATAGTGAAGVSYQPTLIRNGSGSGAGVKFPPTGSASQRQGQGQGQQSGQPAGSGSGSGTRDRDSQGQQEQEAGRKYYENYVASRQLMQRPSMISGLARGLSGAAGGVYRWVGGSYSEGSLAPYHVRVVSGVGSLIVGAASASITVNFLTFPAWPWLGWAVWSFFTIVEFILWYVKGNPIISGFAALVVVADVITNILGFHAGAGKPLDLHHIDPTSLLFILLGACFAIFPEPLGKLALTGHLREED